MRYSNNMNKLLSLISFILIVSSIQSQIWSSKNATIRFFSTTPIEDIEGINNYAAGALNAKTGKVFFKVMMKSFKFEKALMQEHFNENYIESDKFPSAEFDGIITDLPDMTVSGVYILKVKGKFSLHGTSVERDFTINMKVEADKIITSSKFKIRCNDYNIRIPNVVKKNIQEEIDVNLNAIFTPRK